MIREAVDKALQAVFATYVDAQVTEREAALDAFLAQDREAVNAASSFAESDERAAGSEGWAPYIGNETGDWKKPFVRVQNASKTLRFHVTRTIRDAIQAVAKKAATIEDRVAVERCEAKAVVKHGCPEVLIGVFPTGGGHFHAVVACRFQYSRRTGVWRPMIIMTLFDGELPEGSRPRTLVGPRILKAFAELQKPKKTEVVSGAVDGVV